MQLVRIEGVSAQSAAYKPGYLVQRRSAATAPHGIDLIRPTQASDLRHRPRMTTMRLVCKQGISRLRVRRRPTGIWQVS